MIGGALTLSLLRALGNDWLYRGVDLVVQWMRNVRREKSRRRLSIYPRAAGREGTESGRNSRRGEDFARRFSVERRTPTGGAHGQGNIRVARARECCRGG